MINRIALFLALILLPVLSHGVQLRPESGSVEAGLLKANDPIVLIFDRNVRDSGLENVIHVRTLADRALPLKIQATGSSIIIRPETSWPANETVILAISDDLPLQGRRYSGPSRIGLHVQGDEWDRLEQAMNKAPVRETKSDGYLENGVEVYPLPITPNGDGVNDFLHIARPGIGFKDPYIRIFSPDGIRVMSIASSGLQNGEVLWDGVDRLGHEVRPGPYFIIVEEDLEIIASGVIYVLR